MLWSEEIDGKELHGAAGGDLEPRESAVFCASSTQGQDSIYGCGIILFLKG